MIEVDRRADLIARGAAQWRDGRSQVRIEAREALRDSGWSAPVIEAALDDVLADLDEARARAAVAGPHGSDDARPVLVILPGNVLGPAIASAYCAAAAGARAILKSPGVEQRLAPIVRRQFERLGGPLAGALEVSYWRGGDEAREDETFARVRRIVVLGSDPTVASVLRRSSAAPVVAYGTSFSVGVVTSDADAGAAADAAARDVCMFDQRGCLSPQTIYVEGDDGRAVLFAHALAAALERTGAVLPRGRIDAAEAAAVSAEIRRLAFTALTPRTHALDTLVLGPQQDGCPRFVVAVESFGEPAATGFGRIVVVKPFEAAPPFPEAFRCDTIGIAGRPTRAFDDIAAAARATRPHIRLCALGQMQRPPFGYRPTIEDFA